MQSFNIAEATPGDLADIAALFRAYAAELPVDLARQGFALELARLPGDYASPKGAILIARGADGAAIGCIGLRPLGDRICEMKRLCSPPRAKRASARHWPSPSSKRRGSAAIAR